MRRMKRYVGRQVLRLGQRGSALLVSLMVMVGLSLLGLAFVAVSETESAIANNERNGAQTLAVAEAGGKAVVEWFQDPQWALAQGLMPANDPQCAASPCIKIQRMLSLSGTPTTPEYQGFYKAGATDVLFDRSYRDRNGKFYGTEDNPDVLINDTTAPSFMTKFNIYLFNTTVPATITDPNCTGCDNVDGGRVTEIRVFAPPMDGGFTNNAAGWTAATGGIPPANGFTNGGARFGIATIRVTATKYNRADCGPLVSGCRALATRTVKMVIAEWPVPGPAGPVQSAANLTNAGNVQVHWGRSTSEGNLSLTKTYVAVPWHDAYNIANIERGYDNVLYPVLPADPDYKKRYAWLYELIGRSIEDPWWGSRARGTIAQLPIATQPHPQTWDGTTVTVDPTTGGPAQSNMFQLQTKSDGVNYREVLFPRIDYNFWKQVAVAASDQTNVKYLKYSSGEDFTDSSGCTQEFREWVDTLNTSTCHGGAKAPPGFYFFDTTDGANPQLVPNPANLTPQISEHGGQLQMKGFIYLNTQTYVSTGLGAPDGYYNMPGEPFRDIGYREVYTSGAEKGEGKRVDPATPCVWNTGANCAPNVNAGDGVWEFQDLHWSNGNGTGVSDNIFNVYVVPNAAAITRNAAPTTIAANTEYFVVPYTPGCNPGDNSCGACNCSEPHEPYLNFIYPDLGTPEGAVVPRWQNPAAQTRRPKVTSMISGGASTCANNSPNSDCTSNAYDRDGAMVQLDPNMDGVLYIEGTCESTGNADYFGSILIRQQFDNKGTPNVWFDEKLIKGDWPPKSFNFPRVYVSTVETEN